MPTLTMPLPQINRSPLFLWHLWRAGRQLAQLARTQRADLMHTFTARTHLVGAVATRLSIRERGLLKEGFFADVVVFDPATIGDRATFTEPHRLSVGMKHVFVNGAHVWNDGRHTGAKPGRIVRGPGWKGAIQ